MKSTLFAVLMCLFIAQTVQQRLPPYYIPTSTTPSGPTTNTPIQPILPPSQPRVADDRNYLPPGNPNTNSRPDSNADLVDKVTTAVLQRLTDVVNKQINAALANYVLPDSVRNSIAQQAQTATLNQISTQGLNIGQWLINQESGSYLVFRDTLTSKTRDSRYAMTAGVYKDL